MAGAALKGGIEGRGVLAGEGSVLHRLHGGLAKLREGVNATRALFLSLHLGPFRSSHPRVAVPSVARVAPVVVGVEDQLSILLRGGGDLDVVSPATNQERCVVGQAALLTNAATDVRVRPRVGDAQQYQVRLLRVRGAAAVTAIAARTEWGR